MIRIVPKPHYNKWIEQAMNDYSEYAPHIQRFFREWGYSGFSAALQIITENYTDQQKAQDLLFTEFCWRKQI